MWKKLFVILLTAETWVESLGLFWPLDYSYLFASKAGSAALQKKQLVEHYLSAAKNMHCIRHAKFRNRFCLLQVSSSQAGFSPEQMVTQHSDRVSLVLEHDHERAVLAASSVHPFRSYANSSVWETFLSGRYFQLCFTGMSRHG